MFVGVDVGTGSARVGLFTETGELIASAKRDIQTWKPQPDFVQQSSTDIWHAICHCTRQVVADIDVDSVKGIGFDATCSLVVLDQDLKPVSISPKEDEPDQNIIVWMDHRANKQADSINQTGHAVLEYVGGKISPEMQTPKLLWLKENMPWAFERAAHFFDLPDYLTFRATGDLTRSMCSTVCKMTYLGHEEALEKDTMGRWSSDYFQQIGLPEFVEEGFSRIGTRIRPTGEAIGQGLTKQAAKELGLAAGTPVSVSIIDAHAGGVGVLGASLNGEQVDFDKRLALIGGTSSCHMAVSPSPRNIPGIWGPYFSAMVPGLWLNEGGQSATGALIDHVVYCHHQSQDLQVAADTAGQSPYEWLNNNLVKLAGEAGVSNIAMLARDLHVCPYHHGNRSPRADPTLRGMVSGLTLSSTLDDLTLLYLATVDAVAHGTRHIINAMNASGYEIDTIVCCGGSTKNPLFLQEHADITGCRLILPQEPEAVLLGSAMLGAVAAGVYKDIPMVMKKMSQAGRTIEPNPATKSYHDKKHKVFHELYETQMKLRFIMEQQD